jgi:hypothetical protein
MTDLSIIENSIYKQKLIFTYCNFGYVDFVNNYIHRIKELQNNWNLLVVCIDKPSYEYFQNLNYKHTILYELTDNTVFNEIGNDRFIKLCFLKLDCLQFIYKFLCELYNDNINDYVKQLLYTDTDMFVYRDFIDDLDNYLDKEIFLYGQSDFYYNQYNPYYICTGFLIFNFNNLNYNHYFQLLNYHNHNINILQYNVGPSGDQQFVNSIINHFPMKLLPRNLYPNGDYINNNDIPKDALLIHYNWMTGYNKHKNMLYNCHIKFNEIQIDTKIIYPPFRNNRGKILEEYFYEYYRNKVINTKVKYLPLYWTNIINHYSNNNINLIKNTLNKLNVIEEMKNNEKKFFTITQHDDGFFNLFETNLNNLYIFSAGKYYNSNNNIDIPLIYDGFEEHSLVQKNLKNNYEIEYLYSFIGNYDTHPIRKIMFNKLNVKSKFNKYFRNPVSREDGTEEFVVNTLKSKFGLAPRGYGCTSYRLYEIFLLGRVPVYIHDNECKIPYKEIFDFKEICVLIHIDDIDNLEQILSSISDSEYQRMLDNYQRYKHLFTINGLCEYIINKIMSLC